MSAPPSRNNPQLETTRRVALAPADWSLATWRPRVPLPRPAAPAFDRRHCLARLRRLTTGGHYYAAYEWTRVGMADTLEPEEATFWLRAMTQCSRDQRPEQVAADLETCDVTRPLDRDEVRRRLRDRAGFLPGQILLPLASLFTPVELLEVLLDPDLCVVDPSRVPHYQLSALQANLVEGFRRHVLPYLDEAALESLRRRAREVLPSSLWSQPGAPTMEQFLGYRLAPVLGLHRELTLLVSTWPDNLFPSRGSYDEWRRLPREMIFGLGDPWLVEQHLRRLALWLRNDADARAWLAHTETRGIDFVVQSIRATHGYTVPRLVEVLCLIEAPEAARALLELRIEGHATPPLRHWLDRQVGNAVAGLLPLAAGRGKLAEAARAYLRDVRRRGMGDVVERSLASVEGPTGARLRQAVLAVEEVQYPPLDDGELPAWLRQGLLQMPSLSKEELPDWVVEDDFSPLIIDGKQAGPVLVRTLVRLCRAARMDCKPAVFATLAEHDDGGSAEAFAWRLVEQWRHAGAAVRDAWALHAVGWLGGDGSVLRLAALVREWTGPAGRRRSGVALEALRAIGSPLALQQLSALARQGRVRQVRLQARSLFEQAAASHGLSRGELEDRSVPRLGFEGEAGPTFDFGQRRFQALLAPGLRVLLRDTQGQVRHDLPSPGVRDDAESARQAIAEWRRLRKTVREVFKEQALRFEHAMVSGQRWSLRHFRDRVLGQPLLAQLARLLLWAGYDDRGRVARLFRITEDNGFVDAGESPLTLTDLNSVRVVHPVELGSSERLRWSEVWADHELIAPFAQLGRRLFIPDEGERRQRQITWFRGGRVPALTVAGLVRARDWQPVLLVDRRPGEGHGRYVAGAGVTAVVAHPNVGPYVYPNHRAEQEIASAFFLPGKIDFSAPVDAAQAVPLGDVPSLVFSEVCETLAALRARGKE